MSRRSDQGMVTSPYDLLIAKNLTVGPVRYLGVVNILGQKPVCIWSGWWICGHVYVYILMCTGTHTITRVPLTPLKHTYTHTHTIDLHDLLTRMLFPKHFFLLSV